MSDRRSLTTVNAYVKKKKAFFGLVLVCSALLAMSASFLVVKSHFDRDDFVLSDNALFFDRYGNLLRFIPDQKGERHIWISGDDIPDVVKGAFIVAEDERFYDHPGFDLAAIIRALRDNLRRGRIVSGASTITQQVSRLIYPRKRTYKDKIVETLRSIRMEICFSKEEILEQYLNRVPMGRNIIGVELASWAYFGKSSRELTPAEAALLASLPKAPSYLNPHGQNLKRLLKRKDWVLTRMAARGYLSKEALREAQEHEITFHRFSFPNEAPHFVDFLVRRLGEEGLPGEHHTTIDLDIQKEVEGILASHEARLAYRGARQSAVIVIHNPTMEVLASAGSMSYSSKNRGYNNGMIALRSAGSTLKPLVYALALESGYTVASLLEDTLRKYRTPLGDYTPNNYDRKEYGPVTMRGALGNSLNISAIKMLEVLGLEPFYELLKRVNLINYPEKGADHYGLGLVLGNPEVSLEQLVAVYAMFANGGVYRPLHYLRGEKGGANGARICSGETAYIISDILSDPSARLITFGNTESLNFPFRVSLKTGTSTRYRDGWTIGYTPKYTVGVWVGNFEGNSTFALSGAAGAAPIFKDIINFLYRKTSPFTSARPNGVVVAEVCGISGMRPNQYCNYVTREFFIKGTEPEKTCTFHTRDKYFHDLPTTYASWVFEKNKKGFASSYRLRGFSKDLETIFADEWEDGELAKEAPGIRVKKLRYHANQGSGAIRADKVENSRRHYSIGDKLVDRYGVGMENGRISIIYPLSNDRFILDNNWHTHAVQIIKLEAVSSSPLKYIDWFIDGRHYARVGPPYHVYWKLQKGKHNITAVTPANVGDSLNVVVE